MTTLVEHQCIHCERSLAGEQSDKSDFFPLLKFECNCIIIKTSHGIIYGYTKYINGTGFVERVIIAFERYVIKSDYGANGAGAFYPNRDPETELKCNAPNIYDLENGLLPYLPVGHMRRISGESWFKRLPPKDFTGMTIDDVKRWIKMIENFQ